MAASATIIYVLVDRTVRSKGLPARSCFWDKVLGQNPPKSTTVYKGMETSVVKAPEKTGN